MVLCLSRVELKERIFKSYIVKENRSKPSHYVINRGYNYMPLCKLKYIVV